MDNPKLSDYAETAVFPRYTVLGNPQGDVFLRLTPPEWEIVKSLNGTHSVAYLRQHNGAIVDELLAELNAAGLLAPAPGVPRRRMKLTMQGFEVRGGNRPVRMLHDWLLRPVFTVAGAVALTVSILAGGILFLLASPWRTGDFVVDRVPAVSAALIILLFGMAADICHELGHAVTTVHYGRRISGFGLGFHWGAPSFYVDAGAALFLSRKQRVLQSASGIIVDLTLAAMAQLAAVAVSDATAVSALHLFTALAYLDVMLNMLPILGLDGYWVLADALDRPALRQEATTAAINLMRRDGGSRGLAAYGFASWIAGLALIGSTYAAWWQLFGDVNHALWDGGLVHQALAAWMLLPQLGMVLHLVGVTVIGGYRLATGDDLSGPNSSST